MEKLLFGISGLPIGDSKNKFTYKTGIEYLHSIGLDAMELPFVRSINVTEKNRQSILDIKNEKNFYLSAHGSYFINLNAIEEEKREKSKERIENGAKALKSVGGRSLVFHPGYYLDSTNEEAFNNIKEELQSLSYDGVDFRLETTGKPTQFGSYDELVRLCKDIPTCKLCVDFSHVHARGNGILKDYDDFAKILDHIGTELGDEAIKDMHIHLSGIAYTIKGEKNHLPFDESDFNYKACLKAFVDFNVKGCIICESPILENDALLLKKIYESL